MIWVVDSRGVALYGDLLGPRFAQAHARMAAPPASQRILKIFVLDSGSKVAFIQNNTS